MAITQLYDNENKEPKKTELIPKYKFTAMTRAIRVNNGSVISEDTQSVDDSSTKIDTRPVIFLTRNTDDEAYKSSIWAFENDAIVADAVSLHDNTLNTGVEAYIDTDDLEDLKNEELIKAVKFLNDEIKPGKDDIRGHISALVRNRDIVGVGISVIRFNKGNITGLIDLDPRECKLIKNARTGKLGDGVGIGLDPKNPTKDVAIVQEGYNISYDSYGNKLNESVEHYYFDESEILIFANKDRGKIWGVSPVRRVLRLIEIKLLLQNVLALLVKRFGPQVYIQLGNENVNFQNMEIPSDYINATDSDGNQVSADEALEAYKDALFSNVESSITDWVNGDNILQILEYGMELKTINPSAGMLDLSRYISLFSNYIKIGILELNISGRVDVTSGVMEESITKDLKDKVMPEREEIMDMINERYTKYKMIKFKNAIGKVKLRFKKPLDIKEEKDDVELELQRSKTIYNYFKAGVKPPEYLMKKWKIEKLEEHGMNNKNNNSDKKDEDEDEKDENKDENVEDPSDRNRTKG